MAQAAAPARRRPGDRGARPGAPLRRFHRRGQHLVRGARRDLRRWGRTAPARPPPSACCGCCPPPAAIWKWRAWHGPRPGARAHRLCRRSSRCTATLTVRENLEFFGGAYGLRGQARQRVPRCVVAWTPGQPAARRHKQRLGRPAARAGDPVPGRTDQRHRPGAGARVLARHHRAGAKRRHHRHHHALHGRGGILRPHRHPGRGPHAGPGHAGRAVAPRPAAGAADMNSAFIAIVEQGRAPPPEARHERVRIPAPLPGVAACGSAARQESNMAVGLLLPAALILLFGYGLSFDVKHAPLAVVMEDASPGARGGPGALGHGLPGAVLERQHARGRACARARSTPSCACRRISPPGGGRAARARASAERQQLHHRADAGRLCAHLWSGAPGRARGRQAGRRRRRGGAAHGSTRRASAPGTWCPACWCWC